MEKQRNSISHVENDKLFRTSCACKDLIQKSIIHDEFKRLRNIVTYETKKSKKDYFEKNRNDTSLIWKGIRHLITLKHKSKKQPSIFTVKGKKMFLQTLKKSLIRSTILYKYRP